MFGNRPTISRNTPFDKSVVKEVEELVSTPVEALENFLDSPRVKQAIRGTVIERELMRELDELVTQMNDVVYTIRRSQDEIDDIMSTVTESAEPVGQTLTEEDHIKALTDAIKRTYKRGDDIEYVDARTQEQHTGEFKGIRRMGGRPYAQVETGKELLNLPVFQIVVDAY